MRACVVEQSLANVFPNGVRAVEAHRIGVPDLDSASTANAIDSQNLPRDFIEAHLMDW
jgi:hypothetical protein